MKTVTRLFFGLGLLLSGFASPSDAADGGSLTVVVNGVASRRGVINIGLYYGADGYSNMKHNQVYQGKQVNASEERLEIIFTGLETGEYGVSVYHDENGNGKLDTNVLGIPKEKYGFSNNASGLFGPPSFADAKIEVTGNRSQKIEIELK
jgi:uncharacterized protein (DUF2141 family)